jgi:hypothetical protein
MCSAGGADPYESGSWLSQSDSDSVPSTSRSRSDSRWSACCRAPAADPASPVLEMRVAGRATICHSSKPNTELLNARLPRSCCCSFPWSTAPNPCCRCDKGSGSLLFAQPQHGALPAASRHLEQRPFQQIDCGFCGDHFSVLTPR